MDENSLGVKPLVPNCPTFLLQVKELRSCSADQLMYVKEDLILPHNLTFYELIVKKVIFCIQLTCNFVCN